MGTDNDTKNSNEYTAELPQWGKSNFKGKIYILISIHN